MRARAGPGLRLSGVSRKAGLERPWECLRVLRGKRSVLVLLYPFSLLPPSISFSACSVPWRLMSAGGSAWTPLLPGVWWTQPAGKGRAGQGSSTQPHPSAPACTPALAAFLQTAPASRLLFVLRLLPGSGHTGLSLPPQAPQECPAGPGALPLVDPLTALIGAISNSPSSMPPVLLGFL